MALITNVSIIDYDVEEVANHEEVIDTANKSAYYMETLITEFVKNATD